MEQLEGLAFPEQLEIEANLMDRGLGGVFIGDCFTVLKSPNILEG